MEQTTAAVAPPQTLGESRVRVKFNVAQPEAERKNVDSIKYISAHAIDICEEGKVSVDGKEWNDNAKKEAKRLWDLAQTAYEAAAMWAVKAATYGL